jgi:hypothetical protein
VKKAKKAYAQVQKQIQHINKEYDVAHTVSHQVNSLSKKFDYLAKEVVKAAKSWKAPAAKAAKKAITVKKHVTKKKSPIAKKAKPATTTLTTPQVPLYKAPPLAAKTVAPITPKVPGQTPVQNKPAATQPARNPFSTPPITPHNIAQKPLTGGTTQAKPDTSHGHNKPFNFKDDF